MEMAFCLPNSWISWRQASKKGNGLDIADSAADFHNRHIDFGVVGHGKDTLFDFVGDVGNDLDSATKVFSGPLFFDDRLIDLPCGDGVGTAQFAVVNLP